VKRDRIRDLAARTYIRVSANPADVAHALAEPSLA
jgi:hypothetical protein